MKFNSIISYIAANAVIMTEPAVFVDIDKNLNIDPEKLKKKSQKKLKQ